MSRSERRRRGWFVTFEGPDGAGKSTQVALLAARARAADVDVVLAREPGGTGAGERIRAILLDRAGDALGPRTDALLFNAARAQLVAEVISPALERGALVVCDRFADSTLAYQGYGVGLPVDELRSVARFATGGLVPDLTILLDLPAPTGLGRKDAAEQTRFEAEFDEAYHARVRAGFLDLAAREPTRFVTIDASSPRDEVEARVLATIARLPDLAARLA